jgi:hypothetical protein
MGGVFKHEIDEEKEECHKEPSSERKVVQAENPI